MISWGSTRPCPWIFSQRKSGRAPWAFGQDVPITNSHCQYQWNHKPNEKTIIEEHSTTWSVDCRFFCFLFHHSFYHTPCSCLAKRHLQQRCPSDVFGENHCCRHCSVDPICVRHCAPLLLCSLVDCCLWRGHVKSEPQQGHLHGYSLNEGTVGQHGIWCWCTHYQFTNACSEPMKPQTKRENNYWRTFNNSIRRLLFLPFSFPSFVLSHTL